MLIMIWLMVRDKNHKEFYNSLVKHIIMKMIDNVELDPNLCTKRKVYV